MSILSAAHFHDEQAAYAFVEALVWPEGRICPHCGTTDHSGKLNGKSTRNGVYKCYDCRKPFTVKVGTIFESSHIKLHVWLQAIFLVSSSKKGISSNQLARTLGLTVKSAWFMSHRIREAMRSDKTSPMGGPGSVVEIDETYIGKKAGSTVSRGWAHKNVILGLVTRDGSARTFHVQGTRSAELVPILRANVARESKIMTDDATWYQPLKSNFAGHGTVKHSRHEYVLPGGIHTNTIEGYFSIFKRGMRGIYQHCSEKHLHRYLAEFDFRYNQRIAVGVDDTNRAERALKGIVGKRLTYRTTHRATPA